MIRVVEHYFSGGRQEIPKRKKVKRKCRAIFHRFVSLLTCTYPDRVKNLRKSHFISKGKAVLLDSHYSCAGNMLTKTFVIDAGAWSFKTAVVLKNPLAKALPVKPFI